MKIEVGKTYINTNEHAGKDITRLGRKIHVPLEITVLKDNGALVGLTEVHCYDVVDEQGNKSVIDDEDADKLVEKV